MYHICTTSRVYRVELDLRCAAVLPRSPAELTTQRQISVKLDTFLPRQFMQRWSCRLNRNLTLLRGTNRKSRRTRQASGSYQARRPDTTQKDEHTFQTARHSCRTTHLHDRREYASIHRSSEPVGTSQKMWIFLIFLLQCWTHMFCTSAQSFRVTPRSEQVPGLVMMRK